MTEQKNDGEVCIPLLVVEDNPDDILIIERLLSKSRRNLFCKPVFVKTVTEALEKLKSVYFQIVLLDLNLPDSQGMETFYQVRKAAPAISIVINAGVSDEEMAREAIAGGAQDYIVKGQVDAFWLGRVLLYAVERQALQREREEFVGMVVHELRSPMMVAKEGIAQILDGLMGEVKSEQREFLKLVLSGMTRLEALIDDLLDVTRIELGKMTLDLKPVDLALQIKKTCQGFLPWAEKKGLELRVRVPAGPVTVNADADKMNQVLTNLLSNAVKYTEKGWVEVTLEKKGTGILCSIRDSGIGIPKDQQAKMFEKFHRIGNSREKGTGLGLVIVRAIIEAHGATLGVESDTGKGTCFSFELPAV